MKHRIALPLLCASFGLLLGCGSSDTRPKVVPVTGTVTYQGKPVGDAQVTFWGDAAATPAVGQTDAEGKFQLITQDRTGAVPGKYKVTVSKTETLGGGADNAPTTMDDAAKAPQYAKQTRATLPAQYADQSKTPLEQTVTDAGPNDIALELN